MAKTAGILLSTFFAFQTFSEELDIENQHFLYIESSNVHL